ncbi:MAG: SpoIIE family protein phosphatase [Clostridiales bacterium]|nr:SpoIIE family protein phosphatase [Clostridiales bacterium]
MENYRVKNIDLADKGEEIIERTRLIENLDKTDNEPKAICDSMIHAVDKFCVNMDQFDDITMLALKYGKV